MLPLFVTLKKVYDRNVGNKYRIYLLLGVIIFNLIDYIYSHSKLIIPFFQQLNSNIIKMKKIAMNCSYLLQFLYSSQILCRSIDCPQKAETNMVKFHVGQ